MSIFDDMVDGLLPSQGEVGIPEECILHVVPVGWSVDGETRNFHLIAKCRCGECNAHSVMELDLATARQFRGHLDTLIATVEAAAAAGNS